MLCFGISSIMGPALGNMLNREFGFVGPFWLIGGIYMMLLVYYHFRRKRIDDIYQQIHQQELDEASSDSVGVIPANIFDCLERPRAAFGFAVVTAAYFSNSFVMPQVSLRMISVGNSPVYTTFTLLLMLISFIMSMPVVISLAKQLTRRGIIFLGLSLLVIGISIGSLDSLIKIDYCIWLTRIGLSTFGVGYAMILIAALPEIIDVIEDSLDQSRIHEQVVCNMCAGYFVALQVLGETMGSMCGSLMSNKLNGQAA